jgi:predicted esterase YcpF (UPF0227 family)
MLLYLHGFRSSPQSFKAQLLARRMDELGRGAEYFCPQLPFSPNAAMDMAVCLTRNLDPAALTLLGSSLGGYYATYLAEQLGCRAVMLNPAMRAFEKLAHYVGPQTMYHDNASSFDFKPEYLDELRRMYVPAITRPERYLLVAATGDELLDWREMAANFPGARHKVIQGSDHGLSDFADYMDEVLAFAGIEPPI